MADIWFLRQSYDAYCEVEPEFEQALDESLGPRGPAMLFDLVAGFGLPAGSAALDVGCGEGGDAIELARRFGLKVLGIDPVPRQIEVARRHLAEAASDQPGLADLVSIRQGVAEVLPAENRSVDLVWCRDVLEHAEDFARIYSEFARVLRPGGTALVYQMFATERLEPAEARWLLTVMGCTATSMNPDHTEAAISSAGLRITRRIVLGSEWGEYKQETSGDGSRDLVRVARLLRDPGRYISRFGQENYNIALGSSLWLIYRMIGKFSARIYVLSGADV